MTRARPSPRSRNRPRAIPERDFGPTIRQARGDVVAEDRPDPASSNGGLVRGARVADGLLTMLRRGWITTPQWHAASRFRDDYDASMGVSDIEQGDNAGIRSPCNGGNWPSDYQLDASTRCREVWRQVGTHRALVVNHVVLCGGTIHSYAAICGRRGGRARLMARRWLIEGLDAVEAAYAGMGR